MDKTFKVLGLIGVALIAGVLMAQVPTVNTQATRYVVSKSTKALTIQQPSSNASQVHFETADVYCASAASITIGFNGGAATGTALTIVKIPPTLRTPTVTAWYDSNVSSPTAGAVYNVPDLGSKNIDLNIYSMGTGTTATNFTITTSAACTINIIWTEQ